MTGAFLLLQTNQIKRHLKNGEHPRSFHWDHGNRGAVEKINCPSVIWYFYFVWSSAKDMIST
jgi:hypothetical protein